MHPHGVQVDIIYKFPTLKHIVKGMEGEERGECGRKREEYNNFDRLSLDSTRK